MSELIASAAWTDHKRYWWLLGLLVPLQPIVAASVFLLTGQEWPWWLVVFVGLILIPAADYLVGVDTNNPPDDAVVHLAQDRYYRHIVYAYIPLQYVGTIMAVWLVASGQLSLPGCIAALLSVSYVNGLGINTAHELGHKRNKVERFLSKLTLAPVAYGHFFVEHNLGHHKNVATPEDPASAKMGESFWVFLPRTMMGSLRSAWRIERQRLQRRGLGFWHWRNEILQAWAMTVIFFSVLTLWLGWFALIFLVLQAYFGASLLEVVNYIEHYGLLRQKGSDGCYERCQPHHSWNSDHIVTNLLLYQLQRHSDHHAHPTRPYQALRHFDGCPQLPSGYASMLLLAYFPPLWRRVMDPRVAAHFNGDLGLANVLDSKRAGLIQRYGNNSR